MQMSEEFYKNEVRLLNNALTRKNRKIKKLQEEINILKSKPQTQSSHNEFVEMEDSYENSWNDSWE